MFITCYRLWAIHKIVPIMIASLTTIAELFSLSSALAGTSLIWELVATAIVWGLAFSTVLTLICRANALSNIYGIMKKRKLEEKT